MVTSMKNSYGREFHGKLRSLAARHGIDSRRKNTRELEAELREAGVEYPSYEEFAEGWPVLDAFAEHLCPPETMKVVVDPSEVAADLVAENARLRAELQLAKQMAPSIADLVAGVQAIDPALADALVRAEAAKVLGQAEADAEASRGREKAALDEAMAAEVAELRAREAMYVSGASFVSLKASAQQAMEVAVVKAAAAKAEMERWIPLAAQHADLKSVLQEKVAAWGIARAEQAKAEALVAQLQPRTPEEIAAQKLAEEAERLLDLNPGLVADIEGTLAANAQEPVTSDSVQPAAPASLLEQFFEPAPAGGVEVEVVSTLAGSPIVGHRNVVVDGAVDQSAAEEIEKLRAQVTHYLNEANLATDRANRAENELKELKPRLQDAEEARKQLNQVLDDAKREIDGLKSQVLTTDQRHVAWLTDLLVRDDDDEIASIPALDEAFSVAYSEGIEEGLARAEQTRAQPKKSHFGR